MFAIKRVALTLTMTMLCICIFTGCPKQSTQLAAPPSGMSLPRAYLSQYDEGFDTFREDLWEKGGLAWEKEQGAAFQFGELNIENGRLVLKTRGNAFSKAGFSSRYLIEGDFDIQIDCEYRFKSDAGDQVQDLHLTVLTQEEKKSRVQVAAIGLLKEPAHKEGRITSFAWSPNRLRDFRYKRISGFQGSFRLSRTAGEMTAFYKVNGQSSWIELNTFKFSKKPILVGISLANYLPGKTRRPSGPSLTATLDNYKINSAYRIIENDI